MTGNPPDVLPSRVATALGEYADDYEAHREVRNNDRNAVYEVTVDGRRAALKTTDSQPGMLAREGAVVATVAERTPVPVPESLAAGDGSLLLAWADGQEYDADAPVERRRARLRAVGRTLARLHRATEDWFDGHGELESGGQGLTSTTGDPLDDPRLAVCDGASWPARFEAFLDEWATPLDDRHADVVAAVTEFVEDHREAFAGLDPVLVHGEPAPDHVRFGGEPDRDDADDGDATVSALLDWEISQAAPGEFDLAWAEMDFFESPFHGESTGALRDALCEGYEQERPLPPGSACRRQVYRAAFTMRALQNAATAADRAGLDAADLRASMRAHVFERLDTAENVFDRLDVVEKTMADDTEVTGR